MPLTQKSLALDDIVRQAFRKLNHGQSKELTPVECAALMEDAILSEEDGMLSKEDLRATLNEYGDLLKASLNSMVPEGR